MTSATITTILVGLSLASGQIDLDSLLHVDSEFHNTHGHGFPWLPPPRTTRQTAGTTVVCVPAGTCITSFNTNSNTNTNTIDPRIVVPGSVLPPGPTICPFGQVACAGLAGAAACGQRYVAHVGAIDGPSVYGAYPWQAFIRNQTAYTGSGVLLDSLHVLTAAHKVNLNSATPGNIQVYMGVHDPLTTLAQAQVRTVASVTIHPNFNPSTLMNDIAVLRLSAPIPLGYQTNIGTACLPLATSNYVNSRCVVSGWGTSSFSANDAPSTPQRQVTVPIVPYPTCRASMMQPNVLGTNTDTFLDPNGELCAGGEAQRDACSQDGGSPLVCPDPITGRFNVAGLVIWGKNCGQPGVYGVYVDVPKYRAWIDSTIATLLNVG